MIIKRPMLYSPKAGEERMLHIYLPEDYYETDERYPVMYFFDGHNLFSDSDATYGKSWGLADYMAESERKMIIVGMECSHTGHDRLSEYCPYDIARFIAGPVHGTGRDCMDWIVNEVKPLIDREYRTYSFREATGIAGSSMGGLMSLYAVSVHNKTFSKAACLSSAVGACFTDVTLDLIKSEIDPDTRVYMSWGTEESGGMEPTPEEDWDTYAARKHIALESMLKMSYADVMLYCQRGGHHCEADWEKQIPVFMEYLWDEE